jgi:His/Glu/Gln/Arg/opine family amino acid ABC transporter permease subunit
MLHGFLPALLAGAGLTLALAAAALAIGTAIGLLGAALRLWGGAWARAAAGAYVAIVRGVPDLLIIFLVYFGGTVSLSAVFGRYVEVDAFTAGATALGFVFGAYATEVFRGAILGVARGQIEGARSLGLRPAWIFAFVTLPQAWRLALPPYGNQTLVLLKQTSLVSVVGLEELMRKAGLAAGFSQEPFTFYLAAAALYLAMTGCLSLAFRAAEWRAKRGLARV